MTPTAPCQQASPEAIARVLALTMMVDCSIHPREVSALDRLGAHAQLGLSRDALLALLGRCFEEQMRALRTEGRARLVEDACIDTALAAITRPQDRLLAYRLVVELLPADGQLAEAELALLQKMLDHWHLRDVAARHLPA
jgi:uncharacterized tellurite resistance protein B-like protein